MKPAQLALLADARLSADARIIGLHLSNGEDWQAVEHDEFRRLLGGAGRFRVSNAIGELTLWGYVERRAGGKGHADSYRFSSSIIEHLNDYSPPKIEHLKDSSSKISDLKPDSSSKIEHLNGDLGGDYRGGEDLSTKESIREMPVTSDGPRTKPDRKKPNRPLPEDWQPNDKHRELAAERGLSVEHEADKLRDWARAGAHRKADWDATFRNWLRNAKPNGNGNKPSNPNSVRWLTI